MTPIATLRCMAVTSWLIALALITPASLFAQTVPIIDMHLHALHAADQGPPE